MSEASLMRPRVLIPFVIVTLIWGSTWIVIRDQISVVPPSWSVAYRFAVAAAAMFAYALITRAPLRIGRNAQPFVIIFGTAQFALNFNFVYRAEGHITSGLVAVVFALLLVPNAIFSRIFLKTPVTARFLGGSAVALIGVGMLILHELRADAASASETLIGVALTIIGVLSASAANVMQATQRARALPMATMLAGGMVWGTAIDAAYAYATAGPPVFEMRAGYVLGILYLGVFASAVAFTAYFGVIRAIGPGRAAYSSVLVPLIAMTFSTIFEGYLWSPLALGGGAVAMVGLLVALSARRDPVKSQSPQP